MLASYVDYKVLDYTVLSYPTRTSVKPAVTRRRGNALSGPQRIQQCGNWAGYRLLSLIMTTIPEIWRARLLAAALLCIAGCYTEVPFDEVGDGETAQPTPYSDTSADERSAAAGENDPFDPAKTSSALDIEVVESPEPSISEIPRIELDTPTTEDDERFAASMSQADQPTDDAVSAVLDSPIQVDSGELEPVDELPMQITPGETDRAEIDLAETDATDPPHPIFGEPAATEPFELADKPFELEDKPVRIASEAPAAAATPDSVAPDSVAPDSVAPGSVAPDSSEPTLADEPTADAPTVASDQPESDPAATLAAASTPMRQPALETPTQPTAPSDDRNPDPLEVSAKNTRHIAWLLGAKLSFALLAPTDAEQARLALVDARQLADILKITWQQPTAPASVTDTLAVGREIGGQLAENYSPDHAALVEIAFKTTILLALFDEHRELVHPIVGATAAACVRAGVPEARWQAWQQQVLEAETSMDARDAVFALHHSIEQMLAPPPARSEPLFR
jgi:hypothetical protein